MFVTLLSLMIIFIVFTAMLVEVSTPEEE